MLIPTPDTRHEEHVFLEDPMRDSREKRRRRRKYKENAIIIRAGDSFRRYDVSFVGREEDSNLIHTTCVIPLPFVTVGSRNVSSRSLQNSRRRDDKLVNKDSSFSALSLQNRNRSIKSWLQRIGIRCSRGKTENCLIFTSVYISMAEERPPLATKSSVSFVPV